MLIEAGGGGEEGVRTGFPRSTLDGGLCNVPSVKMLGSLGYRRFTF
jgi:hypothetical protein